MATSIQCPKCSKSLKVDDATLGKRVRCPACANVFLASEPVDEVMEVVAADVEEEKRRPGKSPPREVDDDEDDEPQRPRRKRRRRDEGSSISPPIAPLLFAGLALTCSCAPAIGAALGYMAYSRASAALDDLPGGRRAQSARTLLGIARIVAIVSICLSVVWLAVSVVLGVINAIQRH